MERGLSESQEPPFSRSGNQGEIAEKRALTLQTIRLQLEEIGKQSPHLFAGRPDIGVARLVLAENIVMR
jgi:hypothetical protein